jgi:hypothetical protein
MGTLVPVKPASIVVAVGRCCCLPSRLAVVVFVVHQGRRSRSLPYHHGRRSWTLPVGGHGRCHIGSYPRVGRRCQSSLVVVDIIIVVRGHAPASVLVVAIKVKGGSGRAALIVL